MVGLGLVFEAWTYPERLAAAVAAGEALEPPSSYPDRREARHAMVVLRDGTIGSVERFRGQDVAVPSPSAGLRAAGRLPAALRRSLDLPSGAFGRHDDLPDARVHARRWWLWTLATVVERLAQDPSALRAVFPDMEPTPTLGAVLGHLAPDQMVASMPLPVAAYSVLLVPPPPPGRDRARDAEPDAPADEPADEHGTGAGRLADWEAVRVALVECALARGDAHLERLARWADAELLAFVVDAPEDPAGPLARLAAAGVDEEVVAFARTLIDPAAGFSLPAVELDEPPSGP